MMGNTLESNVVSHTARATRKPNCRRGLSKISSHFFQSSNFIRMSSTGNNAMSHCELTFSQRCCNANSSTNARVVQNSPRLHRRCSSPKVEFMVDDVSLHSHVKWSPCNDTTLRFFLYMFCYSKVFSKRGPLSCNRSVSEENVTPKFDTSIVLTTGCLVTIIWVKKGSAKVNEGVLGEVGADGVTAVRASSLGTLRLLVTGECEDRGEVLAKVGLCCEYALLGRNW